MFLNISMYIEIFSVSYVNPSWVSQIGWTRIGFPGSQGVSAMEVQCWTEKSYQEDWQGSRSLGSHALSLIYGGPCLCLSPACSCPYTPGPYYLISPPSLYVSPSTVPFSAYTLAMWHHFAIVTVFTVTVFTGFQLKTLYVKQIFVSYYVFPLPSIAISEIPSNRGKNFGVCSENHRWKLLCPWENILPLTEYELWVCDSPPGYL